MTRSREKSIGSLMVAKLLVDNKRRWEGPVIMRNRRMQILLLGALVVTVGLWFWFLILFFI